MIRTSVKTKKIYCFIALLITFLLLIIEYRSRPSAKEPLPFHRYTDSSFREQLIKERLKSHQQFYDHGEVQCKIESKAAVPNQDSLNTLAQHLRQFDQEMISYPENYFRGRGIVLAVGPRQYRFAKVNLKMIEFTSTQLPVQIWYSDSEIAESDIMDLLDVSSTVNLSICSFDTGKCQDKYKRWQLDSKYIYKPESTHLVKSFPYKPSAIISSTFQEVLFLDCDAYLTRDAEELFLNDPMYEKFGALLYPDSYLTRQHPKVWQALNTTCGENEYEIDSATILVDKKRVWKGLYLTKLMNDHNEVFYQYSGGDKDTFRLAFRYLHINYYLVMTPCATGRFDGEYFCGVTLCKTDSLSQHIYVNHVHMFKYDPLDYNVENLAYTRIGLDDPNDHSLLFQQCRLDGARSNCFHIIRLPTDQLNKDNCYIGRVLPEEIEDHQYTANESLLFNEKQKNRLLLIPTANVMGEFVDRLLKSIQFYRVAQ